MANPYRKPLLIFLPTGTFTLQDTPSFPRRDNNWASKAVLGERVYLNRDKVEIPDHHNVPLYKILNSLSSAGLILAIWSTVYYSVWGAVLGVTMAYLGKSWFLDRMVWLYEDMKNENETYSSWEY